MRKLLCSMLGHRYRVVQEFNRGGHSRRVQCLRCDGDWAMHDELMIIADWDHDFDRIYRDEGYIILEPKRRITLRA